MGEKLRDLLLTESMKLETETLLMFAGRCEHVQTVIAPALRRGAWVVCDRFTDATYAYQGGGRELGAQQVAVLEQWVHPNLQPDLTFLFDVPIDVARQRLTDARDLDRFEREDAAFFERTRSAYYARASEHPHRFRLIDSTAAPEMVRAQLLTALQVLIASQGKP